MIQESHPLQELFQDLVGRHYAEEIGIRDPQVVAYVSHLLAEFCEAEQLYKVRDAANRPLSDVGEMLLESDPVYGPAPSFDRERQVRKHIGDYIDRCVEDAGIIDFTWHCLRHTFISRLVMKGVDLRTVQELAGHKTISMTVRYAHLAPEHNQAAVERLDSAAA